MMESDENLRDLQPEQSHLVSCLGGVFDANYILRLCSDSRFRKKICTKLSFRPIQLQGSAEERFSRVQSRIRGTQSSTCLILNSSRTLVRKQKCPAYGLDLGSVGFMRLIPAERSRVTVSANGRPITLL